MDFVKDYNASAESVDMLLYQAIGLRKNELGGVEGISGAAFASELNFLASTGTVKKVRLRINSPGGSVVEGLAIIAAMIQAKGAGVVVDTYIDGIAGSMGGFIAIAGDTRYAFDYSRLMIHAPSGGDAEVLAQFNGMLSEILRGQTKELDIKNIMSGKADTWLTAKQAEERGYIDKIVKTGRKALSPEFSGIGTAYAEAKDIIKNINTNKMDILTVRAALALGESGDIEAAINDLKAQAQKVGTLEAQVSELEGKLKQASEANAAAMVDAAINAGKFDAKDREDLVKQAIAAPDAFAAIAKNAVTAAAKVPIEGASASVDKFAVSAEGKVTGPGLPAEGMNHRELDKAGKLSRLTAAAPDVAAKAFELCYPGATV